MALNTTSSAESVTVDPTVFRRTLAEFASGVTVVTGGADDHPLGFACQSFSSVSLEPPLVMFCVDRLSRTWPGLRKGGRFCANILADDQEDMCWRFGSKTGAKFEGLDWSWSDWSTPSLPGVLARIHAEISAVHAAGDHDIVIGRVLAMENQGRPKRPLLFFRGTFDVDAQATDTFSAWNRMGGWI